MVVKEEYVLRFDLKMQIHNSWKQGMENKVAQDEVLLPHTF